MKNNIVFLDTSVLLTAVLSSQGGSFYILDRFKNKFEFQINKYIFDEIVGVLDKKFSKRKDLKNNLFLLIGVASIKIVNDPSQNEIRRILKIINKKDAPILASALKHASYLLTLDNDFRTEKIVDFTETKGLMILKPEEFIKNEKNFN